MSVSLWDYSPEKCDGDYCPGDCDLCDKETSAEDIEVKQTSKYINADEYQNFLATARLNYPETLKMDWKEGLMFAINAIGGFSSADVVEVVRCKDCKWYDGTPYCIETDFDQCEPDAYCSKGKRK